MEGIAIIDGVITGDLEATGFVRLAEGARIEGNLVAESVKVYGKIGGNLKVKTRAFLGKKSKLAGDLIAQRLKIEDGAFFNGKCDLLDYEE